MVTLKTACLQPHAIARRLSRSGPVAETVLSELIAGLRFGLHAAGALFLDGHEVQVSRSGIQVRMDLRSVCQMTAARSFVDAICATGKAELAGLVARDSLRLEGRFVLYGGYG